MLVVIASTIKSVLSVEVMALIVASLAWMFPTRTIRSQVLTIRNRAYVEVGRFSGQNDIDIIFDELLPNLMPYLAASFVGAVGAGILAAIGLEALGLGPQDAPTLGMTIFWSIYYGATLRGMWWWWGPPIVILVDSVHRAVLDRARPRSLRQSAAAADRVTVSSEAPLLEARHVTKIFGGGLIDKKNVTVALSDFSLRISGERPSITAVVGESGSGKTTLARSLLGLATPTHGEVRYRGANLQTLSNEQRRRFLHEIQVIFQDPFEVYNPFYKIDHVLETPVKKFKLTRSKAEARALIDETLRGVGLRPEETLGRYPHQLSGGQRQRIMVARALLLRPAADHRRRAGVDGRRIVAGDHSG